MFGKKTVKDINVKGKIVLVRTDYNVPMENGIIADDLRIKASIPTIKYLLDEKADKIIVISHLGRPKGRRDKELSLEPVAIRLQELLPDTKIKFVPDNCGPDVEEAVEKLPKRGILVLENLRFSADEEKNSESFAQEIVDSVHADIFVQDGFAVVHRAHASTEAITHLLPSVAGLLVESEVSTLLAVRDEPEHPFLVIIGGSKVEEKSPLIEDFSNRADIVMVGGKIAADGYKTDKDNVYVASDFVNGEDGGAYDIGPRSTGKIIDKINEARTIVWNGLLGKAEDKKFSASSEAVAEAIGQREGAITVIGGGDTVGFVENLMRNGNSNLKYTLVSTGGGAALELFGGMDLPGLDALEDKD